LAKKLWSKLGFGKATSLIDEYGAWNVAFGFAMYIMHSAP
jgi:hypothetical protein